MFNETDEIEKEFIDNTRKAIFGKNELLLLFADCQELADWKAGKRNSLDNYGSYQISEVAKNSNFQGIEKSVVKSICKSFKERYNYTLQKLDKDLKRRFNETEDDGSTYKQAHIIAISVLNGRVIFLSLFPKMKNNTIPNQALDDIKKMNKLNQTENNNELCCCTSFTRALADNQAAKGA